MSEMRTALVTGASRGIGKAIAEALVAQGVRVLGTATSEAGAGAIDRALGEQGKGYVLDVSDEASIQALLESLKSDGEAVTILVNNAGITRDMLAMRLSHEDWDTVIRTNLNSVFYLSKGLMRGMMKQRWGRIISISSVIASMGNAGQANYAAAKAGMEGLTRSLAAELGSRNITVNAVAPGFIQTDMTDGLGDDLKSALLERVPLRRLGKAEEIAAVVAFLASDAGGYITGETIHVNGGLYMQ
jgi:3-oxoacyl-[acyl-carrier protein] reductase